MKNFTFVFVLFLIGKVAFGQETENNQTMRTVFDGPEVKSIGGYGALDVGYTTINKLDAVYFGARGVVVINHMLALGLGVFVYLFIEMVAVNILPR